MFWMICGPVHEDVGVDVLQTRWPLLDGGPAQRVADVAQFPVLEHAPPVLGDGFDLLQNDAVVVDGDLHDAVGLEAQELTDELRKVDPSVLVDDDGLRHEPAHNLCLPHKYLVECHPVTRGMDDARTTLYFRVKKLFYKRA